MATLERALTSIAHTPTMTGLLGAASEGVGEGDSERLSADEDRLVALAESFRPDRNWKAPFLDRGSTSIDAEWDGISYEKSIRNGLWWRICCGTWVVMGCRYEQMKGILLAANA